jgi:hypothetical protein
MLNHDASCQPRPPRAAFAADCSEAALPHWVPGRLRLALAMLLESFNYAQDLGREPWDFAVELSSLVQLGLSNNDCRWLIARGLVEHAQEITSCHDDRRRFTSGSTQTFTSGTCFVLTGEGLRIARQSTGAAPAVLSVPRVPLRCPALPELRENLPEPRWDMQRRELRLGRELVKAYKVPAPNQEIILAAFEEEHWPPRIDDPLPVKGRSQPQRRLHDAILSLNRNQRRRLIRFSADGLGRGIRWEPVELASRATISAEGVLIS